jgi:hypothetical protein
VTPAAAVKPVLGLVGGAGQLGAGLARRWARAGYSIVIGSRDPARGNSAAAALPALNGAKVSHASYLDTAQAADIVVLTVPYAAQREVIELIAPAVLNKILLETTVPILPGSTTMVKLPEQGSAAMAAQKQLAGIARVVSAFHNVPASRLLRDAAIDCDVLVFGDAPEDRQAVMALVEAAGLRGVHGGPLINSAAAEALTSVLIGINKHYKSDNAGIRITGIG